MAAARAKSGAIKLKRIKKKKERDTEYFIYLDNIYMSSRKHSRKKHRKKTRSKRGGERKPCTREPERQKGSTPCGRNKFGYPKVCWVEEQSRCAQNKAVREGSTAEGVCRTLSKVKKNFGVGTGNKEWFCQEREKSWQRAEDGRVADLHKWRAMHGQGGGTRKNRRGKKNNKKHTRVRRGGTCGGDCCGGR